MRRAAINLDVYTARVVLFSVGVTLLMSACQSQQSQQNQSIKIDGSSTVYPITETIVEQFNAEEESAYMKLYRNFHKTKVGTAFGGQPEFTMTIDEVLSKTTEY